MYTGYLLTEQSRKKLLEAFPPAYENVVCHHITEQFGVPVETDPPEMPKTVAVVGHINSKTGVEGLLVEINGSTKRPSGGLYHITHSLAKGRKAVETNSIIDRATPCDRIELTVEPKTFTK